MVAPNNQDRSFTLSSKDCKAWAVKGSELLYEYLTNKGVHNNLFNLVYLT